MVRVGTVAVDSTKLAANASTDANRTHDQLREEAARILGEAADIDAAEDARFGERRGDELPAELADAIGRPARIRELLERARRGAQEIEAERAQMHERRRQERAATGRAPTGRPPGARPTVQQRHKLANTKYNLTDPDSAVVHHRGTLLQGYNVHSAVADGQIILAMRATGIAPDQGQLAPTLQHAQANLARVGITDVIGEVLADSGYWNSAQIGALQRRGTRVLVPPMDRKARSTQTMQPETRRMREILATEEGQRAYRRRQQIAEPVFAHIKHHRAITRLLRRGRAAVQAEIDLIATTHNLLKLWRHSTAPAG